MKPLTIADHADSAALFEKLAGMSDLYGRFVADIVLAGPLNVEQKANAGLALKTADAFRSLALAESRRHARAARAKQEN